jgi:hypothetical protein
VGGSEVHMKEQRNACRSLLIRTKVMRPLGKKKDGRLNCVCHGLDRDMRRALLNKVINVCLR